MEPSASVAVPPGFRFHPTDEELVGYYLKKKVASQRVDLDVIRDIDLYRIEPWDLQDKCGMGYEEQNEWYFFSHKDKKYPTGTRTNRATMAGFWKATGRDKAVYDKATKLIGMRKTLVFYKGRAPNGQKTDWIMHEYRLESDHENAPPQEEGWVVCRAFKKKTSMQCKNMEGWDSSYVYDETSGVSSVIDPIYARRQPQANGFFAKNLLCKREIESEALASFIHSSSIDHFLQLPQLKSPSQLPMLKRVSSSSISLVSENNHNNNNNSSCSSYDQENNGNMGDKVTDWRALDKFVASQLSQDPEFIGYHNHDHNHCNDQGVSNFNHHDQESNNSDIEALLLLHGVSGREDEISEGNRLMNSVLNSSSGDTEHWHMHI